MKIFHTICAAFMAATIASCDAHQDFPDTSMKIGDILCTDAIIKQGKEYTFLNLLKTKNNLIDLSIGWQLSAASLNSTIFNGIFYEKCNEI